jgi:hypothetical protein
MECLRLAISEGEEHSNGAFLSSGSERSGIAAPNGHLSDVKICSRHERHPYAKENSAPIGIISLEF